MEKKIIIIGGGIAGLSAGIYAQKNGFEATIIEMNHQAGGQLTAWDREGYRFDYCLHWLIGTDHGIYNNIWRETNVINDEVEVINHDIFVKLEDEEQGDFYVYNNLDEWEKYLVGLAPEDEKAIHKMCRVMKKGDRIDQFEDAPGERSVFDYINAALQTGSFIGAMLKYRNKTSKELFENLGFKNERLIYFFDKMSGDAEFSAVAFLIMFGWFHAKNAGYLKGGSEAMADRMADKFTELGGKFMFDTRVKSIIIDEEGYGDEAEAEGVILESGEKLYADHIIGACDGKTLLFEMLNGKYIPKEHINAYENWNLFTPLVMVSFGINGVITSDSHNTNYAPKQPVKIGSTAVKMYSISNRSMYDNTFAPAGKTTLQMSFESPWKIWKDLKDEAYTNEKAAIEKKAIELLKKHYPNISEKIEVIDISTPKTTVEYTGVWQGAYEGFLPQGDVLNGLPMTFEGLENFTMIGQWLFPGGGLPPSAQSGKWAIQKLCKEEEVKFDKA